MTERHYQIVKTFTKEVELDSRKRIPLAAFKSVKPGQRYRISEGSDGVLLAEPVVSVLKKEIDQKQNKSARNPSCDYYSKQNCREALRSEWCDPCLELSDDS